MKKDKLHFLVVLNLILGFLFLGIHKLGYKQTHNLDIRAFTFLFSGFAIFCYGFISRIDYKEQANVNPEMSEINWGIMLGCWIGGACIVLGTMARIIYQLMK